MIYSWFSCLLTVFNPCFLWNARFNTQEKTFFYIKICWILQHMFRLINIYIHICICNPIRSKTCAPILKNTCLYPFIQVHIYINFGYLFICRYVDTYMHVNNFMQELVLFYLCIKARIGAMLLMQLDLYTVYSLASESPILFSKTLYESCYTQSAFEFTVVHFSGSAQLSLSSTEIIPLFLISFSLSFSFSISDT